jgi:hypothetical protein
VSSEYDEGFIEFVIERACQFPLREWRRLARAALNDPQVLWRIEHVARAGVNKEHAGAAHRRWLHWCEKHSARLYARGRLSWPEIRDSTGIAFGDVLLQLARQQLQLPLFTRPEQVDKLRDLLQASGAAPRGDNC